MKLGPTTGVVLGTTEDGRMFDMPRSMRERSIHVIGPSREGKSKLFENMIRQDIVNGHGLGSMNRAMLLLPGWCFAILIRE